MNNKRYKSINDESCGWIHTTDKGPTFPCLNENLHANWVIVGAGFTGLAAAYRIAELKPEDSIIVLDAEQAGKGASSRNSGFIVDITLNDGGSSLADESTQQAKLKLNRVGIEFLKKKVEQFGIDCDWDASGKFHCAADWKNIPKLQNFEKFLNQSNQEYKIWEKEELGHRLGTDFYLYGVQTMDNVLVNPAALMNGLLENLPDNVRVYERSPVLKLSTGESNILSTPNGSVTSDRVIVAINALMPRFGFKRNRVFPLTLTASLTRPLNQQEYETIGKPDPWGVLSASSMGATVRLTNDRRILVRNTAEWFPALTMNQQQLEKRRYRNLLGLKKRFPNLTKLDFEYTWSGNVCISRNSKPVFEKISDQLLLAGCYNAGGVAMGSLFGKLIVDYALGYESDELTQVLEQEKPCLIPPRPLLDLGLKVRMMSDRFQGRLEA